MDIKDHNSTAVLFSPYLGKDRRKCEVASVFGYLIGVRDTNFSYNIDTLSKDVYDRLDKEKPARIVRNLCAMRNQLMHNYKAIKDKMLDQHMPAAYVEEFPSDYMAKLTADDISVFCKYPHPKEYIQEINRQLKTRIDACKDCFPDWVEWKYIRPLFLMPAANTTDSNNTEMFRFYESKYKFPYQTYMNWEPDGEGNLLSSDLRFLTAIYKYNKDEFKDLSKVSDASEKTKNRINQFLNDAGRVVFIVDCENSDPYKFIATINALPKAQQERVTKIILCDDVNTSAAWELMKNHVDIPIQYILSERVLEHKSLLDVRVTAETCKEHYRNNVDSFVLVTSDSDYFSLVEAMPDAKYLMMLQRENTSYEFVKRLSDRGIEYAYADDFYTGDGDALKQIVVIRELKTAVAEKVQINIEELLSAAVKKSRAQFSDAELSAFRKKFIKPMHLEVSDTGDVSIVFGKA